MATNFTVDPSKQATFKQFNAVCHRYAALLRPEKDKTRYELYRAFRKALAIHTKANGFLTMGDVQKALKADKVPAPLMKLLQAEAKAEAKPKAKAKPKAAKPKADPRDAKIAKLQAQLDALQTLLNDM